MLDDKVYVKWPNGSESLLYTLSCDNTIELEVPDDSCISHNGMALMNLTVKEIYDRGATFKDGSSLYVSIDDPMFSNK